MKSFSKYSSILLGTLPFLVQGKQILLEDYSGAQFFSKMDFFSGPDPTSGHVRYLDMPTANSTGLAGLFQGMHSDKTVYLGTDSINPSPNGRSSVRVESQRTYDSGIFILDASHMPGGVCGTWPANWLLDTAAPRPQAGEIDIVEVVNLNTDNIMALHVDGSFIVSGDTSGMLSSYESLKGDVNAPDQPHNKGAVAAAPINSNTFGSAFNKNMGGVYATEVNLAARRISIWFFPRDSIPADIISDDPQPSTWGKPLANFAGDDLDFAAKFKKMQIIINLTFCGEWAGKPNVWGVSECAKLADTCEAYVSENPTAFEDMYWAINSLKVFEADGTESTASSSSTPTSSSSSSSSSEIISIQAAPTMLAASNSLNSSSPTNNSFAVPTSAPPGTAIPRIPYINKQSSASNNLPTLPTTAPLPQPSGNANVHPPVPWLSQAMPLGPRPSGFHRVSGQPAGQPSRAPSDTDSPVTPPEDHHSTLETRHDGETAPSENGAARPGFNGTRGPPTPYARGGRWNGTGAAGAYPYGSPSGVRPSGAARPNGAAWPSSGRGGAFRPSGFRTVTRLTESASASASATIDSQSSSAPVVDGLEARQEGVRGHDRGHDRGQGKEPGQSFGHGHGKDETSPLLSPSAGSGNGRPDASSNGGVDGGRQAGREGERRVYGEGQVRGKGQGSGKSRTGVLLGDGA